MNRIYVFLVFYNVVPPPSDVNVGLDLPHEYYVRYLRRINHSYWTYWHWTAIVWGPHIVVTIVILW